MRSLVNNILPSGADQLEAARAALFQPSGGQISQAAIQQFLAAQAEVERLGSLIRGALLSGAAIEGGGPHDAGLFVEAVSPGYQEKAAAFAEALRVAGIDPDGVWASAKAALPPKESAPRLRAWQPVPVQGKNGVVADKARPKGRRIAPTADGKPVQSARGTVGTTDAEAA